MLTSHSECLLLSGMSDCIVFKAAWHCFDSWSLMLLKEVWFPSKLFILLNFVLYCCVTNDHNFSGLKQHPFILQFLWVRSLGTFTGHFAQGLTRLQSEWQLGLVPSVSVFKFVWLLAAFSSFSSLLFKTQTGCALKATRRSPSWCLILF